jgi:hypothetical protein
MLVRIPRLLAHVDVCRRHTGTVEATCQVAINQNSPIVGHLPVLIVIDG